MAEYVSLRGNASTRDTTYFVGVTVVIGTISTALYSMAKADLNARILYFLQEQMTCVMCINLVVKDCLNDTEVAGKNASRLQPMQCSGLDSIDTRLTVRPDKFHFYAIHEV